MQIKIHREDDGYSVYRKVGSRWKYWLPKSDVDVRNDECFNFFKTKKAAEYAARKEKAREEAEEDTIIEI